MPSTYTNLLFHVVFSTIHRQPLITAELKQDLYHYLGGIFRGEGATLLEINGMPDHVHLLIKCKPTHSRSDLLRKLKGSSAKWLNDEKVPPKGIFIGKRALPRSQ